MRNKLTNSSAMRAISTAYVICVFFYQSLHLVFPFRRIASVLHLEFLSPMLAVFGVLLLGWDLIFNRPFFKVKQCWILMGILSLLCLSTLINIRYDLIGNAKAIAWQAVQMLVLFTIGTRNDEYDWKKIWYAAYCTLTSVLIAGNLISFIEFFTATGYVAPIDKFYVRQGLLEGRLFGVYTSPQYSSVLMLVMMLASVYWMIKTTSIGEKVVFGFIVAQYFLMADLSGARSVRLALPITVCILTFCVVFHRFQYQIKYRDRFHPAMRILLCCVSAAAAGMILLGVFEGVDLGCKKIAMAGKISGQIDPLDPSSLMTDPDQHMLDPNDAEDIFFRPDVGSENISNNRFTIWGNYFHVLKNSPMALIFGASPGGYMKYITDNFPQIYIVDYIRQEHPEMFADGLIYDTHNAYIAALISGGLITTAVLLGFLFYAAWKGIATVMKHRKLSHELLLELSVMALILIASFFDTDLFYKCTSASVTFWLTCGFLFRTIRHLEDSE